MRYFPGVVFCLMAIAIFVYNLQFPDTPFNIPFLDDIGLSDGFSQRGERTWQLMGAIGVVLLVIPGVFSLIQPKPEPLIHDEPPEELR